jgi:hypothetical protein
MAASEPLVVCLEDIHWPSGRSSTLIEYLAVWIRGAPILLSASHDRAARDRALMAEPEA